MFALRIKGRTKFPKVIEQKGFEFKKEYNTIQSRYMFMNMQMIVSH